MSDNKYKELLIQYRQGTISDVDRHELERLALDDPFLFDAIEGFNKYGSAADQPAIDTLLQDKQKSLKVKWLNRRLIGVAASLFILISVSSILWNSKNSQEVNVTANNETWADNTEVKSSPHIADNQSAIEEKKEIEEEEKLQFSQTAKEDQNNNNDTSQNEPTQKVNKIPDPPANKQKNQVNNESDELDSKVNKVINKSKRADHPEVESLSEESMPKNENILENERRKSKPENDAINYGDDANQDNVLAGKTLDIDGNPIAGVALQLVNTDEQTISDNDGNFTLPKYPPGIQLQATSEGYVTQSVLLGENKYYQIVMAEQKEIANSSTYSQILTVGKAKAMPMMGMEDFALFIDENKRFPLEVFGNAKTAEVEVSFSINEQGDLFDFYNESETCDKCFEEAVRLLKTSGKWQTIPENQVYRTSYTFKF